MEDAFTTSTITRTLEVLNDGQWHTLKEIQQKTRLGEDQTRRIIEFLKEYKFIVVDEYKKEAKIGKTVQRFFIRTRTS